MPALLSGIPTVAYLGAAVLFILSLGGLASQQTARRGNVYGIIGMVIAIAATFLLADPTTFTPTAWGLILVPLVVGASIGTVMAKRVAMTGMPELVALLHSFVGLAAVLVGLSTALHHDDMATGALVVHLLEVWAGVAIGAITFTGSIVAWAKLKGSLSGRPLLLPGRHALNAVLVLSIAGMAVAFIQWTLVPASMPVAAVGTLSLPFVLLLGMTVLACILGVHLVMAIGGADMPVVVSLLNSYSGWAAAAAGFMLSNDLLIVTGALVGSSGAILSFIMCKAMNRSIWNEVFGGFGANAGAAPAPTALDQGEVTETDADTVADWAEGAKHIVIVPGYGLAVARAQHLVNEFSGHLRKNGVKVDYAIHPVAGRLPGHMNVLLAEAGVPYDIVLEMDEVNDDLPKVDLVLVIGANDIVNPGAETDPSSPIYGMPVLQVWNSTRVVVFKRGMSAGYAGVQNPLFFNENTRMLFGDAKDSLGKIMAAINR